MVKLLQYNKNHKQKDLVELPYSKSIINRLLILNFPNKINLEKNLINDDISAMLKGLDALHNGTVIHINEAGTAFRFIIALSATIEDFNGLIKIGDHLSTRPIMPLIDLLRQLGAKISKDQEGYKVQGQTLEFKELNLENQLSSQFISALMMIAPRINGGLEINLHKNQSSFSYIQLTAQLMNKMGIDVNIDQNRINIPEKIAAKQIEGTIEKDTSAATFFIALALIFPGKTIKVKDIIINTLQSEKYLFNFLLKNNWIQFEKKQSGLQITGNVIYDKKVDINFSNFPDATLNIIISLAILGKNITASGLGSLNFKESKRLDILIQILQSMNYRVESNENSLDAYLVDNVELKQMSFDCHNDHRVAMALALLSIIKPIKISGSDCVSKSYPYFWREINKIGFSFV
jgi:3-phosphoshikimate 1-carboxyvinyltransferase